jgi:methionine synthase I (cobalamin-dependent)
LLCQHVGNTAPEVLRQCHTGHSNAGRDVIEGLTNSAPVLNLQNG